MKKMFYSLESIRGIAALLVVIYHMRTDFFAVNNLMTIHRGYLFVDLFFVLSGFVIAHNYLDRISTKEEATKFLILRLGRLYPLFIITSSFFLLEPAIEWYTGEVGVEASKVDLSILLFHLSMSQSLGFNEVILNDPSWSISVEFYTYVLFSILLIFIPKHKQTLIFISIVIISFIVVLFNAPDRARPIFVTYDFGVFRCFYGFFIGVLTYKFFLKITTSELKQIRLYPSIVIITMVLFFELGLRFNEIIELVFPLLCSLLILSLVISEQDNCLSKVFTGRLFLFLGNVSFSLYLIHIPVISALRRITQKVLYSDLIEINNKVYNVNFISGMVFMLIALIISLILSYYSYTYFEMPIRNKVKNMMKQKRSKPKTLLA